MKPDLTQKQENFCLAYVETGSASESYRRAYEAGGMQPQSIHAKAGELLAKESIKARIAELRERALERHEVTVDRIVAELGKIAFITFERDEHQVIQNKLSALDKLGKHFGMFTPKMEITGKDGAPLVPETPSNRDLARAILSILARANLSEDTPQ